MLLQACRLLCLLYLVLTYEETPLASTPTPQLCLELFFHTPTTEATP